MAERVAGLWFQGLEYNGGLSPRYTQALAGAIGRANAESPLHPGLYFARYDDIESLQLDIRPAIAPSAGINLTALLDAGSATA